MEPARSKASELTHHSKLFPLAEKLGLPCSERWWMADSLEEILDAIRELEEFGTISSIKRTARW